MCIRDRPVDVLLSVTANGPQSAVLFATKLAVSCANANIGNTNIGRKTYRNFFMEGITGLKIYCFFKVKQYLKV